MASKVYFTDLHTRSGRNLLDKLSALCEAAALRECVAPDDFVALKLHVGEPGNLAVLRPPLVRTVVESVKAWGGKPFLTDANTLYKGGRSNAVDHHLAAAGNGFTLSSVGAPFIIADGLLGKDAVTLKTPGALGEVKIAAALAQADAIIALTHFKGHEATGFGGTLKNLGMGGASRAGKLVQHAEVKPQSDEDLCTGCRRCERYCSAGAIEYPAGKARVNENICLGCGECIITCNTGAISFDWGEGDTLQRLMVEHAAGLVASKQGKCGYISFVMNVSPDCDCCEWNDLPIVPDLGMLAGRDPVALDQACADLVNAAPALSGAKSKTGDKFRAAHPEVDWSIQLDYAEELGLGSRKYELVEVR